MYTKEIPVFPSQFIVDGKHPNLVCGTIGGKIFIHNPHFDKEVQETE